MIFTKAIAPKLFAAAGRFGDLRIRGNRGKSLDKQGSTACLNAILQTIGRLLGISELGNASIPSLRRPEGHFGTRGALKSPEDAAAAP